MAIEKPMKIGIIGLGFGATEFIPSLEAQPEIEIYAGADLRPQALDEFEKRYGGKTYRTAEALCADPNVEAVWISTPNHLHAENAITAANAGKHINLRKPMGITMAECAAVQQAVDRNGVKLLAGGQTQGSSPLTIEMRRVITSGELGPLKAMNVVAYTAWMLRPRMPQEVSDIDGGGVVWRQSPHQIETTRYLAATGVLSAPMAPVTIPRSWTLKTERLSLSRTTLMVTSTAWTLHLGLLIEAMRAGLNSEKICSRVTLMKRPARNPPDLEALQRAPSLVAARVGLGRQATLAY